MGLTPLQQDVRARAQHIAGDRLAGLAAELDVDERFPVASFQALAAAGLMTITAPTAHGGLGADTVALVLALREIARACPSTAVGMSVTNMVAETIARFGTEALQAQVIPPLASGAAVTGSFCLSEAEAGSDAASLRATARRDGDVWVLDGTKAWITSGAFSGVFIVMARTADVGAAAHKGISAFVVEAGTPGLSAGKAEEKTGLRGSNTVPIVLEGCRVPAGNLLATTGAGFEIAMTALDGGRITIGAMANGIARAALDRVVAHLRQAAPGAVRAAGLQTLATLDGELKAAELLVLRAARLKAAAGKTGHRFTREAAMAKLYATENAKRVTLAAVELLGPRGLDGRRAVERLMRDARVTTIFEGTSEIQRLVLARDTVARFSGGA